TAGYLVQGLGATSDALGPLEAGSPWHWYLDRNILVDGLAPVAVVAPVLLAGALFALGAWLFNRRDLH
ncbi:MAG: ABC transporter permease subunit, partial [Acidimicrobiia bacterium]